MTHRFENDMNNPEKFVITLEIVPGKEASRRSVDSVYSLAKAAFDDGRISAVSITDNPGGNPALGPEIIGKNIYQSGMDVIAHMTNRDANRLGLETRALNLALTGIKNILAVSGDYVNKGYGGQGGPVYDLDSVHTQALLTKLNQRMKSTGENKLFFSGCAISPFKYTEGESFAQYAKWCRKVKAGAKFTITQMGYDVEKYRELIQIREKMGLNIPVIGSVCYLTPGSAKRIHAGHIPGAVVSDNLLETVVDEWEDKKKGKELAIERVARLIAILKGLGYKGVHLEGFHKNFAPIATILDRTLEISDQWQAFVSEFQFGLPDGYYANSSMITNKNVSLAQTQSEISRLPLKEKLSFFFLRTIHHALFNRQSRLSSSFTRLARLIDSSSHARSVFRVFELFTKHPLLGCLTCGDCAIQHVGFLCPEASCPKHTRNGACGGSSNGRCEVYPERLCVWIRAYHRLSSVNREEEMIAGYTPPRMWELNRSSSWLNFHLKKDHQGGGAELETIPECSSCLNILNS